VQVVRHAATSRGRIEAARAELGRSRQTNRLPMRLGWRRWRPFGAAARSPRTVRLRRQVHRADRTPAAERARPRHDARAKSRASNCFRSRRATVPRRRPEVDSLLANLSAQYRRQGRMALVANCGVTDCSRAFGIPDMLKPRLDKVSACGAKGAKRKLSANSTPTWRAGPRTSSES